MANSIALPDDLAVGATFDPAMASAYGAVIGSAAKANGVAFAQATPDYYFLRELLVSSRATPRRKTTPQPMTRPTVRESWVPTRIADRR